MQPLPHLARCNLNQFEGLVEQHRSIILDLRSETANGLFAKQCLAFLDLIEKESKNQYFSLSMIKDIDSINSTLEALIVCEYFSIGFAPLLNQPIYSYSDYDKEFLLKNKNEFLALFHHKIVPDSMLDEGYLPLIPPNPDFLNFYVTKIYAYSFLY